MRSAFASPAAVVLLVAAALAGCADEPAPVTTTTTQPPRLPDGVQVFRDGEALAGVVPSGLGVPSYVLVGHRGAEPNIGITSDGSVFVSSHSAVMRSRDNGTTWESVHQHGLLNNDPMLWVDTETDRVYNAPMFPTLACSTIYWSDDFGDSWDRINSAACGGIYDHQKLATAKPGPERNPAAGVLWPTVTYICYNAVATTNCEVSYDGGLTWPVHRQLNVNILPQRSEVPVPTTGCGSGQNGHPAGAPDGTIVFARTMPGCPRPFLTMSFDSGLTWEVRAGPETPEPKSLNPEVAFSLNGTMYLLYQDKAYNQLLARSDDMGMTWKGPWNVMPPGVTTSSFSALVAGSEGRVAMGFLGAREHKGDPSDVEGDALWSLYIVTSEDAHTDSPTFVSYQVTPDEDPVQRGPIWQGGGFDESRNLLDFIDGAIHPDGTFYVAYAEGCVDPDCLDPNGGPSDSRDAETAVGHLAGWSLFKPGESRPGKQPGA